MYFPQHRDFDSKSKTALESETSAFLLLRRVRVN